jgi:hypothetical protein
MIRDIRTLHVVTFVKRIPKPYNNKISLFPDGKQARIDVKREL